MRIIGWIVTILISILMGAVLELNKNTWIGWTLFAAALAIMILAAVKYMGAWKWWKKGLCILGYLSVCIGIVFVSWPPVRQVPASDTENPERTEVYSTADGDVHAVPESAHIQFPGTDHRIS